MTDPLEEFAEVWSDDMLHSDIGEKLTCTEADALAGALTALGRPEAGESLLNAHGWGDSDAEDRHHDRYTKNHAEA